VAYDPNGNQLWVDRIPSQGGNGALGIAIVVGPSGYIYATGTDGRGYITVAYDSTGNRLWLARYRGPVGGSSAASGIAIDASGNVYVTGASQNGTPNSEFATVAYDPNGNQRWVAHYHSPGLANDSASAIAVDSSGQLVDVTGSSQNGFRYDYTTIAYDAGGNQLWVVRYGGPNQDNLANAIVLDQAGNIYVTGQSRTFPDDLEDAVTVAYDPGGNQLWANRFQWQAGGVSRARSMAIDSLGNVVIVAEYSYYDDYYLTVSYDSSGNLSWQNFYAGPLLNGNVPSRIAIDGAGNVYVTGTSPTVDLLHTAYATVAYDNSGNQLWEQRYSGPGSGNYVGDIASGIAVDGCGNVYVTGASQSGAQPQVSDYTTIKYSQP